MDCPSHASAHHGARPSFPTGDGSSKSASEAGALFVTTQCLAGLRALTAEAVRTLASSTLTVAIKSITISSKAVLTSVGGAAASSGRRAAPAGSGTLHILIENTESKTQSLWLAVSTLGYLDKLSIDRPLSMAPSNDPPPPHHQSPPSSGTSSSSLLIATTCAIYLTWASCSPLSTCPWRTIS